MDFGLTVAGFGVGLLIGLTGVGGGAVMTPLLIVVFQVPPAVAVGTDIVFAALTKLVGIWRHWRFGAIRWAVVGRLAVGSLPAALFSLHFLGHLPGPAVEGLINHLLGLVLVATGLAMMVGRRSRPDTGERDRAWPTVALGAILGALVTLTSVGAGALGAAVLRWLYPGLPLIAIVGTDIAHAAALTVVAGVGHWGLGDVDTSLLAILLVGSVPGIILGSRLGVALPEAAIRALLAGVVTLVGVNLVW